MATILVIDDDRDSLRFLRKVLEAEEFSVLTAHRGADGLKMSQEHDVDLVLLDLNMPGMDGHEVFQMMRLSEKSKHIPVIMLTAAYGSRDDAHRGLELGASAYMVKPVMRTMLVHAIQRLLSPDAEQHQTA